VLLEHWPAGDCDDHDRLDQVGMEGWRRRIWPAPPTNPEHTVYDAWVQAPGLDLLDVSA